MKINKQSLLGKEKELNRIKKILLSPQQIENKFDFSYKQIVNSDNIDWSGGLLHFKVNIKKLEYLLFQIHFKRNLPYSSKQRYNFLKLLSIAYHYSHDVRYFNEFLWYYKSNSEYEKLWLLTLDNFFKNLDNKNHHCFHFSDRKQIYDFISKTNNTIEPNNNPLPDSSLHVGLIGSPTFFPKIHKYLLNSGYSVKCYFIPYHSNRIINIILRNKITFKLICLLKKVDFNFTKLNYNHTDQKISEILFNDNLDIGYHKLGFIIKKNIISSFRIGLINDHWALLPFIRGRSTIEYSLLLGVPLFATTHLVEETVDTGRIICIYPYLDLCDNFSKVKHIRNYLRKDSEFRAVDSIKRLSMNNFQLTDNTLHKGLTFYSIHPILVKFIENNILK